MPRMSMPSSDPPWLSPPPSHIGCSGRLSLVFTVAFVPGLLICIVGFLAWSVPMLKLDECVQPLATAVRGQIRSAVVRHVLHTWDDVYVDLWEHALRWTPSITFDPLVDANSIGRCVFPSLLYNPIYRAIPILTVHGNCTHLFALLHLSDGWYADRQNCTHRWFEVWDPTTLTLTGHIKDIQSVCTDGVMSLWGPLLGTTPTQPFTWLSIWNPHLNVGDILEADIALFDTTSTLIGRTGIGISLGNLRDLVRRVLQGSLAQGGRLVLYEPNGLVIAASHGDFDSNRRFLLSAIGDPDLEGAAAYLRRAHDGDLCLPISEEVTLSTDYFIDVAVVNDTHVSVMPLQWCVLLLAPKANVLGPVSESHRFAITFVSATTGVVMLLSTTFGLVVTRHIHRLARGLHALRQYDFPAARRACGACTVFRELRAAQLAYDSLVDAMDAFRKYVPEAVVRGLLLSRIQPLLGMVEQNVGVVFMDLDNFLTMCDRVPVEEAVAATAQLFDVCTEIIHAHSGVIDKFVGDCMMMMWGAPIPQREPGRRSVQCIYQLLQFLRTSPMCTLLPGTSLGLKIGLHSGRCLVGNYGASSRWGYTAIGDVVNVASRLESFNKQTGTHCLITDTVYDELDNDEDIRQGVRSMGRVRLIGRQQAVTVYELSDTPQLVPVAWTDALQLFSEGQFQQATWQLASLTDDVPSCMLLHDMEDAWSRDAEGSCVRVMRFK